MRIDFSLNFSLSNEPTAEEEPAAASPVGFTTSTAVE